MKRSLNQMISIACLLAVGFLTVTPFLPKADADCDYYSAEMCDSATDYYWEKANYAIYVCFWGSEEECNQAWQSAEHAGQWADWVCEHAET